MEVIENNLLFIQENVEVSEDNMFVFHAGLPLMHAACCTVFSNYCCTVQVQFKFSKKRVLELR